MYGGRQYYDGRALLNKTVFLRRYPLLGLTIYKINTMNFDNRCLLETVTVIGPHKITVTHQLECVLKVHLPILLETNR